MHRFLRALIVILSPLAIARSDVLTPVASYEAAETDLTVVANPGDAGLSVGIVNGGQEGAPAATDGQRLLRIQITNEADRKVELRHQWASSTYDLAGNDELLIDVYVATAGARPGLMGVWSLNWSPPDPWQAATGIPAQIGEWRTIALDVSQREQSDLNYIHALIFENLAGTSGVAYVDNLRLRGPGGVPTPAGLAANGLERRNEVFWRAVSAPGLTGYHVYRADSAAGPFVRITPAPISSPEYRDTVGLDAARQHYRVTAVVGTQESAPSTTVSARYNGLSDDELLDLVQEATFGYFWAGAHPNCGMAREGLGFGHPLDTVTVGGTGFGLMTLVAGAERGLVTRAQAAQQVRKIVRFLDGAQPGNPALPSGVQRYHGAWAHHYNGVSGATIAFAGPADNGGDLVETAFLVQGLLTVRQYFDDALDPVETEIRTRATSMWQGVDWTWYRQHPGSQTLYWNWSPTHGWAINLAIRGYNEAQIVYLLAVASPTHAMPPECYYLGWAADNYENGNAYYGYHQWVGWPLGGPLFFTHYSNLGFDPRYKRDAFCNYFQNSRHITLINRAHCIDNPGGFAGYSPLVWGLTASNDPTGYVAHCPTVDTGTITPTAAISAMPYAPAEALAALRHLYDEYGTWIFGEYGFYDAFSLEDNWLGAGYLAIDQGTIVPMIENYRTGLCWRLFMSNPEIAAAMLDIGIRYEVDFDLDGDVDAADAAAFLPAIAGVNNSIPPSGVSQQRFDLADLDNDSDVDLHDAAVFQRLFATP